MRTQLEGTMRLCNPASMWMALGLEQANWDSSYESFQPR